MRDVCWVMPWIATLQVSPVVGKTLSHMMPFAVSSSSYLGASIVNPSSRIVGEREFWSLTFELADSVFDPRLDSETLVEAVLLAGARPRGANPVARSWGRAVDV